MNNQIEIYQGSDGQTQTEVRFEQDTIWLSQDQMASLFHQTKQNISLHINNCYKDGELGEEATVKKTLTVQNEGHAYHWQFGKSIPGKNPIYLPTAPS